MPDEKLCPLKVAGLLANPNPDAVYNVACDPAHCALGRPNDDCCALLGAAAELSVISRNLIRLLEALAEREDH